MYDVVKRLLECASGECFNCSQYMETTNASVCSKELMKQAADAIEKLDGKYFLMKKTAEWLVEKVPRWIPVTERLPDQNSGNLYICLIVGGEYNQLSWYELCDFAEGQFWIQDKLYKGHVTHWMPLPKVPEEET